MGARYRKSLERISGWEAVQLFLDCCFLGLWEFLKVSCRRLWKGQLLMSSKADKTVQLIDKSVGVHCYIKVLGVKYHYVERGPSTGDLVLLLGDAPGVSAASSWCDISRELADSGRRVIALDLRGTGGSEPGSRWGLAPPRAVKELFTLMKALGVSERHPVVLVGHGIGGMLAWYLAHCHGDLISKFVIIGAPHPNLYWQYPPAPFCQGVQHFLQWPFIPERWLAASQLATDDGSAAAQSLRWASSRACDWSGALHYVRGAAWWKIPAGSKAEPPVLLIGPKDGATQVVGSAEFCLAPTLRLVDKLQGSLQGSSDITSLISNFLLGDEKIIETEVESSPRSGLVGRMLGAVAGRGRELTAAVSRARLALPLSPPTPALLVTILT